MGQAGPEVTGRSLVASVNGETVGELQEVNGLWAFQYSPDWLASPTRYALSPKLPLQVQPLVLRQARLVHQMSTALKVASPGVRQFNPHGDY